MVTTMTLKGSVQDFFVYKLQLINARMAKVWLHANRMPHMGGGGGEG